MSEFLSEWGRAHAEAIDLLRAARPGQPFLVFVHVGGGTFRGYATSPDGDVSKSIAHGDASGAALDKKLGVG